MGGEPGYPCMGGEPGYPCKGGEPGYPCVWGEPGYPCVGVPGGGSPRQIAQGGGPPGRLHRDGVQLGGSRGAAPPAPALAAKEAPCCISWNNAASRQAPRLQGEGS
ncbi:hypothetical protein FKM82_029805 [Ascaphus truei]